VTNPVEIINLARRRASKAAALEPILTWLPASLLTALLALTLKWSAARALGERIGIAMGSAALSRIHVAFLMLAGLALGFAAWRSWCAYHEADNLEHLAARIDAELNAQQEILTFAGLVASAGAARSPLFPILWRRVAEYLASFDPVRRFQLNKLRVLARAALLGLASAGLLFGTLVLVSRLERSPYQGEARRLVRLADEIAKTDPSAQELARHLRAAASVLTDPDISLKEKLVRIVAIKHALEQRGSAEKSAAQARNMAVAARGSGAGSSGGSGEGAGKERPGRGEGGSGGQGRGRGKGPEEGEAKGKELVAQARNELAKSEKQLETESTEGRKPSKEMSENRPQGEGNQTGGGGRENQSLAGEKSGESPKNRVAKGDQPGPHAPDIAGNEGKPKPGQAPQNTKTGSGDTRLGETPAQKAYARFYKPGENGPPLGIKDARYVMVHIPEAARAGEGGRLVTGAPPSKATTPYANLPLPVGPGPAKLEERQLVPPRYRDVLR
jgi:hypothetical protein